MEAMTPALPADTAASASPRALQATAGYWFAMFAGSALGTNLGDFWDDGLGLGRELSFASLALIGGLAVFADGRVSRRSEAAFWTAIVALRAASSNVGDFLTHDLALNAAVITAVLGVATLLAGRLTRREPGGSTPLIDARYWLAMVIAGVFGTVGGDLVSHTVGLVTACTMLCAVLVLAVLGRSRFAAASVTAYWLVVLAERAAGTPAGDSLASGRALGLGLPLAMCCSGGLLALALLIRSRRPAR